MKMRFLFLFHLFFILFSYAASNAQETKTNNINIECVTSVNLGDGRMLLSKISTGKPLEGEQHIIDVRKSEYKTYYFDNGLFDGPYTHYRNNKLVEEGHYMEGVKEGVFKEYYSDGVTVKRTRIYREGKLDGPDITFFTNGRPEREKGYKGSVEHGPERRWDHESGTLLVERNYTDGKLDGPQMELIRSNVSDYIIRSNYKMGILDGDYTETYTKDGVVRRKGRYAGGEKTGKWTEEIRYLDDNGKVKSRKIK